MNKKIFFVRILNRNIWILIVGFCGNVPWNQTPVRVIPPPPFHIIFLDWYNRKRPNAVGISIPPPATTLSGDRERSSRLQRYKALFCMGVGGYNTSKSLFSREITEFIYLIVLYYKQFDYSKTFDNIGWTWTVIFFSLLLGDLILLIGGI